MDEIRYEAELARLTELMESDIDAEAFAEGFGA